MIKLENTEVMGWEAAIRGMRNPMNSWKKSDSFYCFGDAYPDDELVRLDDAIEKCKDECPYYEKEDCKNSMLAPYIIGPNDFDLMKRLRNAGTDHRKFMRMIAVYVDITAPLYWWKEFKTYRAGRKFGDSEPGIVDDSYLEYDIEMNSCSTMHKIADKEFTRDDFSHEHLFDFMLGDVEFLPIEILDNTITCLNMCRELYLVALQTEKPMVPAKEYWWQMIQLLPSSYNQKRTVMLNYEVLANMYKSRKNHKLDEWRTFCDWIKTLPYSELITGKE